MHWEHKAARRIRFFSNIGIGEGLACPIARQAVRAYSSETVAPPTIEQLGARLGCGQRTLRRRFKAAVGLSLRSYLVQLRTTRALVLLALCPDLSVTEIAHRMGYADDRAARRAISTQLGVATRVIRGCPGAVLEVITAHRAWIDTWWKDRPRYHPAAPLATPSILETKIRRRHGLRI